MTTGSKYVNGLYPVDTPGGTMNVGMTLHTVWNGGNAIQPGTPRSSYPRVKRPPRPRRREFPTEVDYLGQLQEWYTWKRPRRSLVLLPPQNYTKVQTEHHHATWWYKRGTYAPSVTNSMFDPWGASPPIPDPSHEYKVIEKLRRKVYGSGFNPAVFTAEGVQALDMIAGACTSLVKALIAVKRGDVKGAAKHLAVPVKSVRKAFSAKKTASDRWLELQYGWLPLLSDLEEAGQYVAELVNQTQKGRTKVVGRRAWSVEETSPPIATGSFTRRVTVFQLQYIIYGYVASPVYVPSLQTVATVAWEKLPWSFIADWVIPIGSYLAACRTAADIKGTVVKTLKSSSITTEFSFGTGDKFLGWHATPFGEPSVRVFKIARTVSDEIKPPSPTGGMATSLEFLSWRRAANAVALLVQVFSKHG